MAQKKNKQTTSTNDVRNVSINELPQMKNSSNFISAFLKHCEEFDVLPLPTFCVVGQTQFSVSSARMPSMTTLNERNGKPEKVTIFEPESENIPEIHLTYGNPKKLEDLQKFHCKGHEVSVCLLDALSITLQKYSTIIVLKLQACQINAFGVTQIARMLTEVGCVKDLNLDMNPNTKENFFLLCSPSTKLLFLSLKLCGISDGGVEKIATELKYKDDGETQKLILLNLANNAISEIGAEHIAEMLRTNRSLQSLTLTGNIINDNGAVTIIKQLCMFTLNHCEAVGVRRRNMERLSRRQEMVELILRESQENQDPESSAQQSYTSIQQKTKNRTNPGRRSKKKRDSTSRHDSGPVSRELSGVSFRAVDSLDDIVETLLEPEKHPLSQENVRIKGNSFSTGNFSLQYLNLSFNQLTEVTLMEIISCIQYQDCTVMDDVTKGLLYIRLEGNKFKNKGNEMMSQLKEMLKFRQNHDRNYRKEEDRYQKQTL